MSKWTQEFMIEALKYRYRNNIKGECYYLNTLIPEKLKNHVYKPGYLSPSGLCLYANKKYFIQEDPMTWDILYITDSEEKFNEVTKNAWGGEKGLFRNLSCWDVLKEIQRDGGDYYELDTNPLCYYLSLSDLKLF
jgi:hypothetical protein